MLTINSAENGPITNANGNNDKSIKVKFFLFMGNLMFICRPRVVKFFLILVQPQIISFLFGFVFLVVSIHHPHHICVCTHTAWAQGEKEEVKKLGNGKEKLHKT